MNNTMLKVLVVAPHPDDETLGCGGTILKHNDLNHEVHWISVTNISDDEWSEFKVKSRQKEIKKIAKMYNFKTFSNLDFTAARLDSVPMVDIVSKISELVQEIQPNIVYVNNYNDVHTDHQVVFKAVISATKNFRQPSVSRILMYETLSETEFHPAFSGESFNPNVFVDITDFFSQKCQIMKQYEGEVMESPHPRSIDTIEALAKYRGSRIGEKYAEAFQLIYEKI